MNRFPKPLRAILAAVFWILVWWAAAKAAGNELLFPTPPAVARTWWGLLRSQDFYAITGRSLLNVLTGIVTATLLGALLAGLGRLMPLLRDLILPIMTVIKATPIASLIVLFLIFIGAATVPSLITFLIVLPVVWTNLDEGLSRVDPKLREIATVYRFSPFKRLRVLILPTLRPYFLAACRTSLGLAWKAGIAAEILATPRGTIGRMIGDARQYLETEVMFAWTLTVVLLSLLIEYGFVALFARLDRKTRTGHKKRGVRYVADL